MQIRHDQAHNGFFAEITCTGREQGLDKASFRTQRAANNVSHLLGGEDDRATFAVRLAL